MPPAAPGSLTYPHGFLDFLTAPARHGHRVGDYELQPSGLLRFNTALAAISPESPCLSLDQVATAAQRALDRYPDGGTPVFVSSRMASLARLEALAADAGWNASDALRAELAVLQDYLAASDDLIPDHLPVVGRVDDAVLVDVALQRTREELADFEDFCRFRRVAAECSGLEADALGLSREQWLEALEQSHRGRGRGPRRGRARYAPDPRASLFHVV